MKHKQIKVLTPEQQQSINASIELLTTYLEKVDIARDIEFTKQYVTLKVRNEKNENLRALLLDSRNFLIADESISTGSHISTKFRLRDLVEACIRHNAVSVILYHNHPLGYPDPSDEDLHCTEIARNFLEMIDVRLVDHIIVGAEDCTSFVEIGAIE